MFREIGLCAQHLLTIVASIVNIKGGYLYDHSMSLRIFTLIMDKIFMSSEIFMRQTWNWQSSHNYLCVLHLEEVGQSSKPPLKAQ